MVSVVTGSGLGLVNTSRGVVGANGELGQASTGRAGERLTVNAANGNLVVQNQDGLLLGMGPDVGLVRTYNSQGSLGQAWDGDNGDAWRLGFYRRIAGLTGTLNAAGSTLRRVEADGNEALFTFRDGRYVGTDGAGAYDTLVVTASTATFTDGDTGLTETYLSAGSEAGTWRLTQITDPEGHSVRVTYDTRGLIDTLAAFKAGATTADETVKLVYDTNKRLTQVDTTWRDDAGLHTRTLTRYTYDSSGRLQSVITDLTPDDRTDNKTYTVTYGYDSAGRLSSLTQSDGTRLTIVYESGRVKTITDALGQVTTFSYDTTNRKTTVTDARGQAAVLGYDNTANRLLTLGGAVTPLTLAYDGDGNILTSTDGLGRQTQYAYDARGNLTRSTDASGRVQDSAFDAANRLTGQTQYTELGTAGTALATRYVYDTSNGLRRLRFSVSAEGRVTEQQYNSLGQVQTRISYAANRFSGDATLNTLTTWAGQQPTAGAAVQRQTYTYDLRGALRTQNDGRSTTTYVYDPFGRLVQTIDPQAGTTSFGYDGMDRLLLRTDTRGVQTAYSYDDAGRTSSVTWTNGLRDVSTYDTAGQLITQAQFNGTTALGQTRYAYDKAGRLRMTTDPTGQRRWQLYDAAGRLTGSVDALGQLTEITYDAAGRAVLSTGYAAAVDLAKLVDAQGNPLDVAVATLRPAADPNDRRQWSVYDDTGRLLWTVNSLGEATETRYDGVGRVAAVVQHGQRVATLPAAGSAMPLATLTGLGTNANEPDHVSRNLYDADGLLRGTLDAEGYLTEMRYDAAGRLVERIAYATATPQAQRATGTLAALTPATSDDDRRSLWWFDAQGRSVAGLDADGFFTEHSYNDAGQRTQTLRYATGLALAAAKAATPSTDPTTLRPAASTEDHRTSWTYDTLGRVRTETGADGAVTQYSYDDLGRLVRSDRALATTDQRSNLLRYDAQGRVVAELSALGAAKLQDGQTQAQFDAIWAANSTQHAYDAAGRRIRSTDAQGQVTLLYYDAAGRLAYRIAKTDQGGEVEALGYNAFGDVVSTQRFSKRLGSADTNALQGGQATTALDQKVDALMDPSDRTSTSFFNTAGRLTLAMDALGNKTDYVYDAFGQLSQSTASIDADGGTLRRLVTQIARDRRGLVTSTTQDPGNLAVVTRTEYDAFGRVTARIDGLNRRTSFKYTEGDGKPDGGRQVIITDATGAQRSTTYDAFDRSVRQTDALGNSVTFQYNTSARRLTVTTASGVVTVTDSNAHGQVVKLSDATGTSTYEYDANGNRTRSTDALGNVVQDEFDTINRLTSHTVDPAGLKLKTTYDYDAANRVLAQHVDPDGLNLTTRYEYDGQGRAVRITDPAGVVTRYDLDGEGRLKTQVVDEGGLALTTRTTYDAQGRVLTVRREAGSTVANASAAQVTEYHYDLLGRRIQEVQDPAGIRAITTYDYDAAGQVVRVSDTLGVRKRYVYDAAGRETYCIDALGGTERKEYDAEGRLLRDTHYANAIVTSSLPVAASAQQVKDLLSPNAAADLVQRLSYNKDGRLRYVIDAQGGVSETRYDSLGRVSQSTAYAVMLSGADLASAMDLATSNGDINTLVGKIDDAGRDRTTRFAYDGAGRLRFAVDAAGAVTETVYDKASRVIRTVQYANTLATGATIQAPSADAARDRTTRTVYDAAGRAVQQVDAEGYLTVNQYDKVGNLTMTLRYVSRVQRADVLTQGASVAVLSATATPPAQGAYVLEDSSLTNITSFQYDRLNRRTISIDVEQKFEVSVYNDALGASVQRYNRLGGVATLVYDTMGRLVQESLPVTSPAADGTQQPVVNRYGYDVRGNRTKAIEAVGLREQRTTVYRFDAMNRLVRKIGMAYPAADGNGSLTSVTPLDVFGYNALGQLEKQTAHAVLLDADQPDGATRGGRITAASYDRSGRKVAEIAPDGVRTEFGYDAFGDLVQQRVRGGPDGDRTMHFSYDAVGRKIATHLDGVWAWEFGQPLTLNAVPDGASGAGSTALQTLTLERLEYDSFGNVLRHIDARGNADYAYYDRIGRKLLAIDTAGYATAWDYERSGSVATQETRYAKAVPVAYDVQGKGPTAQALRSALEQVGADPDNRVTQFTLDRLNRVTRRSVLAVAFTYATPSELVSTGSTRLIVPVTGTAQAVTEYSYDGLGHVTQIREQVGQTDRLHSEVWQETAVEYDMLGREISRSAPGYFDAAGISVRPVTTTTYDGVGNIVSSAQLGNGQAADARVTSYSYDGNGRLSEMTDAARNVVRYNFDVQGDLASQFHINVLTSGGNQKTIAKSFQYDGAGRLIRTLDVGTGETRDSRYNAFGEVVAQGSNGGWQEWFEYTALGKVWKTNSGDGAVKFFLHDANGNVTRDLRIGLGSSTTRDLRNAGLADVLADATLVSTVHVYDARNQEVRTLQPRIARLVSEATLAEQFTDNWVSQRGDLNGTLSGSIATPGHSTATAANGSRTPLTGGVPGTAPGGSGNSTGTAVSVALPSGPMAVLAGLNPSNTTVLLPGTTAALTQAAIALQIPSTWPVGHYRVRQTLTGPGTTGTTTLTEVATPGGSVMVGGGSPSTCQIDIEWQPSASNVWQPIAQMSLAKLVNLQLTSATFTWTPITNANTKVAVDLTPESGWGNATEFQLLVDPDDPARTQVLGLSRPPGGRLGIFDLANLVVMAGSNDHQLVLQAFDSNGHLVGGRKYKVAGTDAGTLAEASGDATLYAGGDGTVWARNGRSGDGQVPFASLFWDLGAAHAGGGTLRWRKTGATGDPWNSAAISAPSGGSAFLIGGSGTAIADGSYFFVLEQGDARVTGSFKLTGGALTLDDSRLKPLALTPERVTINGPVDAQGRGRVALTIGSVTVTATTDANGQASFDLSQIRQSLGLDRWSVANRPFSYQGYLDRGNGQKQVTHSEHGTLDLRAPRIDGNETFKFNPDGSTEYEAEVTLTIPSTAGTIKLTPVGGTTATLTLGSDWRLVRNGNELTVNLDGLRPAWGAADQLVDWAFTGSDSKTASGRLRISDKGVTTREGTPAGTPVPQLRLTPPAGTTAATMTLNLGNNQTASLTPTSTANGVWVYDLKPYLPTSGSRSLSYSFETRAGNTRLTRGSGQLSLAANGTITSTAFDERRALTVVFRLDGIQAAQARLNVAGVGNVTLSGTWVPAEETLNPDGSSATPTTARGYTRFEWDATTATAANGPAALAYTLTPQDSSGTALGTAQAGRVLLDPNHPSQPVQLQQQARTLNTDSDFVVSTYQTYNAFGELNESFDERVAERAAAVLGRALTADELAVERTRYVYNTLGKLTVRFDPMAGATEENGFATRRRAFTLYGYDLLGRLNSQTDAGGNRTLRVLLAGSTDSVVEQVAADGGRRRAQYNVFGEAELIRDELGHQTTQSYDAMGQLVSVVREVDRLVSVDDPTTRQTVLARDEYRYDALGNQTRHERYMGATLAQAQVTRTDYDGLGRVVSTWIEGTLSQTTYRYEVVDFIGMNGLQHRGTRRTTILPTAQVVDGQARTQTLVDETDAFGHTTRHLDLSGTDYRYGYDAAARLVVQSGAAHIGQPKGQELRYTYFANGLLQSQIDVATGTRTDYGYDDAGQRTSEAYYKWNPQEIPPGTLGSGTSGLRTAAYQINRLSYDELGRVREVSDANYYRVRYEYDVMGNRRLVDANYADGLSGRTQTYWYRYDAMNCLLVSKGSLVGADGRPAARGTSRSDSGPRIEAGVDGVVLAYDALGQRTEAHYNQNDPARPGVAGPHIDEVYTYSADGFVQAVRQNGVVKLTRVLDEAGRTLVEKDHQNNTRTESTYNRADRLTKQVFIDFKDQDKNSETTFSYYTTVLGGDWRQDPVAAIGQGALAQTITHMTSKDVRVPDTVTRYGYDYWDDARQTEIVRSSSTGSGTTTLSYNANGFLVEEFDAVARIRTSFFNSGNGLILRRERQQNNVGVGEHQFFYADGKRVGDLRNDVSDNAHLSLAEELAAKGQAPVDQNELYKTFRPVVVADFDQNLDPINSGNPTGVPGSYTVRRGDTLTGVAQQLWGDASLWYLIAEANGLSGMESLSEGQLLRVPQQVTNLHNNSQVLRPYNPAEAIGAVDPTVPPHRDRCGTLSQIIGVVVAAVVTFYGGPVGPYIAGAVGNLAQQYSNAAFNGELDYGDLYRRGVPLAFAAQYAPGLAAKYLVDHRKHPPGFVRGLAFDYKGTGVALVAGAVSGGVGSALSAAPDIVRAGASAFWSNATAQQLNRALGRQDEFDWRGLVSSTLAASASVGVSQYLGKTEFGKSLNPTTRNAVGNLVGGSIGQLLLQRDRWDFPGVFASTVGSAIGDAILPGRPGLTNSERLRAMAASYASGDVGETVPVLGLEADDGVVGGFAGSLEDMMRDQAAQDLQGVEWNKYAGASKVLGEDKLRVNQLLDAELLQKVSDERRKVRELQAFLSRVSQMRTAEARSAEEESKSRRMAIEQLNATAGAATTETTSNELTIHTSFPFPEEHLPDSGFLRGYLLGQGEPNVFDTHQPNLAEHIGAGARGLVLMPFKAVTGLAGEVGNQYRDLYNLVAGPKNVMATSALYNSLQREGIGGTLGNMGLSVLSAPIQPVFDVLEGRYEQAGAGLPGMLSAGFGVVRGVRGGGYGALGNTPRPHDLSNPNVLFSSAPDDLAGVERASPKLLSAIQGRRAVTIAEPGTDAERFLNYRGAEAAAFGAEDILVRPDPSKAALLEEFLHGTQQRLGIIDNIGRAASETHVKDFMIRHQSMLGLSAEDVRRLQILKDMGL